MNAGISPMAACTNTMGRGSVLAQQTRMQTHTFNKSKQYFDIVTDLQQV